jgi:hypothetical protein
VIITGVVALAGIAGYLIWKRGKPAPAAAATTVTPAAGTADEGALSTLQTEIGDLQSSAAQDEAQEGTPAPPAPGTPKPPPPKPPAGHAPAMPASVHGSAASSTSIKLTWGHVTGATSYQAHATTAEPGSGKAGVTPVVTVAGTSATLTGLKANTTYTCHVKACNAGGCSSETNGPVVRTKAR